MGPVEASPGPQVHVGRQAIHDGQGAVVGYELLFRNAASATHSDQDDDAATSATILAAFSEFGSTDLLGGRPGFINMTRTFLTGKLPLPFTPESAVLEVVETIKPDAEVLAGAVHLAKAGYKLALDDFVWSPEAEPMLALSDIVKIDVLAMSWEEVLFTLGKCRPHNLQLLAEKVEDRQMLRRCLDEGFELFQGYHLGRPETMTVQTLSPSQLSALTLLGRLSDPTITTEEIDATVRRDPALVYRLLRIANSASSGVKRKVASIRDALVMVGLNRLRSWLVLLSVSSGGPGDEGLIIALTRARTCELVARAIGLEGADTAFTAGLLHGVADALHLTPTMLLERMPALTPELSSALFGAPGPLRQVLDAVLSYEAGDPDAADDLPVPLSVLSESYLNALAWTTQTTAPVQES